MATNIYARVANGVVAELVTLDSSIPIGAAFHGDLVFVDVTSVSPQPGQNWTATETGGAWSFSAPGGPSLAQQAAAAIAAGVAVTFGTSTGLNGTYPITGPGWSDLKDEAQFIATFGGFSNGAGTLGIVLPGGAAVTFTAPAQLSAVVKALGMQLTALKTIAATNAGTLPGASVTVAA